MAERVKIGGEIGFISHSYKPWLLRPISELR